MGRLTCLCETGSFLENPVMITLTDTAVKQLQALLADSPDSAGKGLRVYVETGGCAGMQYGMVLDHPKEDDAVVEREGVRVFVDAFSTKYLVGSTIDFTDELAGAGFRIRNPNATRSCGCGSSFESSDKPAGA